VRRAKQAGLEDSFRAGAQAGLLIVMARLLSNVVYSGMPRRHNWGIADASVRLLKQNWAFGNRMKLESNEMVLAICHLLGSYGDEV